MALVAHVRLSFLSGFKFGMFIALVGEITPTTVIVFKEKITLCVDFAAFRVIFSLPDKMTCKFLYENCVPYVKWRYYLCVVIIGKEDQPMLQLKYFLE